MGKFNHIIYIAFGTTFMPQKRTCDILVEVMNYYNTNKKGVGFIVSLKDVKGVIDANTIIANAIEKYNL